VKNNYLDAYQIAFDIIDKENQGFTRSLMAIIKAKVDEIDQEDETQTTFKKRLQ
jgi:hypothetical protein